MSYDVSNADVSPLYRIGDGFDALLEYIDENGTPQTTPMYLTEAAWMLLKPEQQHGHAEFFARNAYQLDAIARNGILNGIACSLVCPYTAKNSNEYRILSNSSRSFFRIAKEISAYSMRYGRPSGYFTVNTGRNEATDNVRLHLEFVGTFENQSLSNNSQTTSNNVENKSEKDNVQEPIPDKNDFDSKEEYIQALWDYLARDEERFQKSMARIEADLNRIENDIEVYLKHVKKRQEEVFESNFIRDMSYEEWIDYAGIECFEKLSKTYFQDSDAEISFDLNPTVATLLLDMNGNLLNSACYIDKWLSDLLESAYEEDLERACLKCRNSIQQLLSELPSLTK